MDDNNRLNNLYNKSRHLIPLTSLNNIKLNKNILQLEDINKKLSRDINIYDDNAYLIIFIFYYLF